MVRGGGEQHGEEYREVNPLGQVPTLVIDGMVTMTQRIFGVFKFDTVVNTIIGFGESKDHH